MTTRKAPVAMTTAACDDDAVIKLSTVHPGFHHQSAARVVVGSGGGVDADRTV